MVKAIQGRQSQRSSGRLGSAPCSSPLFPLVAHLAEAHTARGSTVQQRAGNRSVNYPVRTPDMVCCAAQHTPWTKEHGREGQRAAQHHKRQESFIQARRFTSPNKVSPKFAQVDRYVVIRAHADAFHAHPTRAIIFQSRYIHTPRAVLVTGFLGVRSADGAVFHADFHWGSLGVQPSKAANGTKEVTKGAPLKHEAQHSERTMMAHQHPNR